MKGSFGPVRDLLAKPVVIRVLAIFLGCVAFFFLGKHWSESASPLIFFSSSNAGQGRVAYVAISPNANKSFDVAAIIQSLGPSPPLRHVGYSPSPPPPLPPPPPPVVERFGIVDENGAMKDDFNVGDFSPDLVEKWEQEGTNATEEEGVGGGNGGDGGGVGGKVEKFRLCPQNMREYIPCLDNQEEIRKLPSTEKGEKFERHCPAGNKRLNCLVPAPKGYKPPIPWPQSRDEVWFSNAPHTRLVDDKGGQNWIRRDKDKFKFPGGGTQFIHGADQYLNQITEMVPNIAFGRNTRVALDVGCGVASFGAFLLSRDVMTLSVAPKDVHENQIQFALERGVPAMVAAFATHRLLYPSQAFDLIHCSRCRISWTRDDGILLLEVNRLLRAGGYFAWAAQPVYKHEEAQQEAWEDMERLTNRICWELVKKEGYIAIWRKPQNNSCYISREEGMKPPLCEADDDPNKVWYANLKPCISRIPENGHGSNIMSWPGRLHAPPLRLEGVNMDAYMSKKELFIAETKYWNDIVGGYIRAFHWKKWRLRNIMDMRAGFGGFAAALIDQQMDSWVMNVVPTSEPNTLPVIYDRGLIGVAHDWCEPFDTYPRTYDFLHAAGLFSKEIKRCNITGILLEMDRILRPGGRAYILDNKDVIFDIKTITEAMGWRVDLRDTPEGPYASRLVLMCQKQLLHS